jgi:hypothetical protein
VIVICRKITHARSGVLINVTPWNPVRKALHNGSGKHRPVLKNYIQAKALRSWYLFERSLSALRPTLIAKASIRRSSKSGSLAFNLLCSDRACAFKGMKIMLLCHNEKNLLDASQYIDCPYHVDLLSAPLASDNRQLTTILDRHHVQPK